MNQRPSTAVRVADLNRSLSFYKELAGFTLIDHRPERDVAVVAYNGSLLLLAGPAAADLAPYLSEANEVAKPGAVLHLPPGGEIGEMLATYQARGIPGVRLEETWWGDRTLSFPDPDGYTLSFWTTVERSTEQILELYACGPDHLERALAGLGEADLDLARAPGKWTIRQIVHHLVDSDLSILARTKMALAEPGRVFYGNPYKPDTWAEALDYAGRPVGPAVTLFRAVREHLVQLLRNLPGAMDRYVVTPAGERRPVGQAISLVASHALSHIEQILETRKVHGK